jgi:hypothetical protein
MPNRSLSQRSATGPTSGFLTLFALVFLLAGSAAAYFLLLKPLACLAASQSWTEAQCTVLSSQVALAPGSGTTYWVDIHYTYRVNGISHESGRYDFMTGSSSGTAGKQAVVDRYPPGARVPCWFDPADPSSAVLSRSLSTAYLWGLFPLPFLAVGGGVLWLAFRSRRPAVPLDIPQTHAAPASAELRPAATPLGAFLVLTLVALFWNGLISVFVWQAFAGAEAGRPDGCVTLFLLPFVLVGLFLIFAVVRQFLVLFNPRLHITLMPGELTLGESGYLQWRLGSGGKGVRRVTIALEGRKETTTTYRTRSAQTLRETFLTLPVVDSSQPVEIEAGGSASFAVPTGHPPSLQADPDRIIWALKAHCDIAWWPDSDDEYVVVVRST